MANALRLLTVDATCRANSGHPGLPLGMADVAAVLWGEFLNVSPSNPHWIDRDRFVLSAGHGSMLLYGCLHLAGFDLSLDDIKNFRHLGSKTPGHPEYPHTPGVETTTGPLGQGFATAVGMAIAEAKLRSEFGSDLQNHFTYVIASDGCLMEGITMEAASLAGHLGLSHLIVLFDDNGITIDGPTSMSTSDDHGKKFESMGWHTLYCDGHNAEHIRNALQKAQAETSRPTLILCKTTIGQGATQNAGTAAIHGSPLKPLEAAETRKSLSYEKAEPFDVGTKAKELWKKVGIRGQGLEKAWKVRMCNHENAKNFENRINRRFPDGWQQTVVERWRQNHSLTPIATRAASQDALNHLSGVISGLVGGSADLTPSNNTKSTTMQPLTKSDWQGNYIHFGIREHAMAAALNGLTLHGGYVAYGGTFLVFSDYMRPAIRLAALMQIPTLFVFTHDSIGLGEDGPTHQPVEHLWGLRDIPHLEVFRPADAIETLECWIMALENTHVPSALILSRQKINPVRNKDSEKSHLASQGAYILKEAPSSATNSKEPDITLWATGSEVSLACEVAKILESHHKSTRVISAPCLERFEKQSASYKKSLLTPGRIKASIEAGTTRGWERYVGSEGLSFGINTFGASGKAEDLFKAFELTPEAIAHKLLKHEPR